MAAVLLGVVPLLLVALLFFLAAVVARVWVRYALERLEYDRRLSATRVFFGESITLDVRLTNRKALPLPWVQVRDEVPEGVTFLQGNPQPSHMPERAVLTNGASLSWYHRLVRHYSLQCMRRGHFTFGPATIQSGDLFGFFSREGSDEKLDHLTVYPRIVPLEDLGIPSRNPFGDLRVRRHLFEDPVRVITTRDYVPGDPLRRIHWKASARLQRLQSRVFEATTTVDLALFLDVRTVEPPQWGRQEHLLETAIMAVASIASHAVQQSQPIGLYANDSYRRSGRLIKLPPSDHSDQFQRVLDALAHVQGLPILEVEPLLIREGRSLPWRTTLVVVTAMPTSYLLSSLDRLRRAGRRTALVLVGEQAAGPVPGGLPVYRVSDQAYWREVESVQWRQAQEAVSE